MTNVNREVTMEALQAFADAWIRHGIETLKNSYRKNRPPQGTSKA